MTVPCWRWRLRELSSQSKREQEEEKGKRGECTNPTRGEVKHRSPVFLSRSLRSVLHHFLTQPPTYPRSRHPSPPFSYNPVLLALSSTLVTPSRFDVSREELTRALCLSYPLPAGGKGSPFSLPSTFPVILFPSFSCLPIYLSIYPSIRVSYLFAIYPSIRLPIYP